MSSLLTTAFSPSSLFWRTYEVTLDNGDGVGHRYGNATAGSANIRMAFSFERQIAGTGARSLTLTNLAPSTIRNIRANQMGESPNDDKTLVPGTGTRVMVRVGYGGTLTTLFLGGVLKARTERAGADIHTHLELQDSESFLQFCMFCKTYNLAVISSQATKLKDILRDIAAAMRVQFADRTLPIVAGSTLDLPSNTYPGGITFNGTCGDALSMLLKPLGMLAVVRNGELQITQANGFDGKPAQVMREDTGLVGEPSSTLLLGRQTVVFKSLMNTELLPERLVTFQGAGLEASKTGLPRVSDSFVGYYRILKSTFKGDTHGPEWTVDCEALPYDGLLTTTSTPL